jgi:hypothetical protein
MVSGGSFEFVLWENNSKMGGLGIFESLDSSQRLIDSSESHFVEISALGEKSLGIAA